MDATTVVIGLAMKIQNSPRYSSGLTGDQAKPRAEFLYLTLRSLRTRFASSSQRTRVWARARASAALAIACLSSLALLASSVTSGNGIRPSVPARRAGKSGVYRRTHPANGRARRLCHNSRVMTDRHAAVERQEPTVEEQP